jgi:hypothetical protein
MNMQDASNEQLLSLPQGGHVTDRPGVGLVRKEGDGALYVVARGSVLRKIDQAIAEQMFGPYAWQSKVHEISEAVFMEYRLGAPVLQTFSASGPVLDYNPADEMMVSPSFEAELQLRGQGVATPGYTPPGYTPLGGPSEWDYWTPGYQPIGDWTPGYQPLTSSAYVPQDNDIVKGAGPALYLIGRDGRRYVFPNTKTYFTREMNFERVRVITDAELRAIPIGGNVTYHPGSRMLKLTTDPKLYVVARGGILRPLASEGVAEAIYGPYWHLKVDDIPDGFFVNYRMGSMVYSPADYNQADEWNNSGTFSDEFGM